jgi:hypothetical protein
LTRIKAAPKRRVMAALRTAGPILTGVKAPGAQRRTIGRGWAERAFVRFIDKCTFDVMKCIREASAQPMSRSHIADVVVTDHAAAEAARSGNGCRERERVQPWSTALAHGRQADRSTRARLLTLRR